MQNFEDQSIDELAALAISGAFDVCNWYCLSCMSPSSEFSVGFKKRGTCCRCKQDTIIYKITK